MANDNIILEVAAKAIAIDDKGRVLILREAPTYKDGTNVGKYHLPGGRLEKAEAFMDGLHREMREETGIEVEPLYPIHVDEWRPVIRGNQHHIIAIFIYCKAKTTEVKVSDEHDEFVWIEPREALVKYDMLPAERKALEMFLQHGGV